MRITIISVLLAIIPSFASAADTVCETKINSVKIISGNSYFANLLAVKGNIFGENYFALCDLEKSIDTGKREGPYGPNDLSSVVNTTKEQCSRWLTAVELGMALDMTVKVTYESSMQSDCITPNSGAYPFTLEVINNASN